MIMFAKSPAHGLAAGLGEPVGCAAEVGQGPLTGGSNVMSKVRSRPGGDGVAWDLSRYFQRAGEPTPHPACWSSKAWSPCGQLRSAPICATLGTGCAPEPVWQPASASATAITASTFGGNAVGSGERIGRLIVRERVSVPVHAL